MNDEYTRVVQKCATLSEHNSTIRRAIEGANLLHITSHKLLPLGFHGLLCRAIVSTSQKHLLTQ